MAIFENKNSTIKNGTITMISEMTYIKGDLKLDCNIYIDGKIEGNVESSTLITIGEKGRIIGKLKAQRIIIGGFLQGGAEADELELINNGKIYGDLVSKKLSIEEGVVFEGTSSMKKDNLKIENK